MCVRKLEWLRPSVCDLFEQKFRRVKYSNEAIIVYVLYAHILVQCILIQIPEKNWENKVNLIKFDYILFYFFSMIIGVGICFFPKI